MSSKTNALASIGHTIYTHVVEIAQVTFTFALLRFIERCFSLDFELQLDMLGLYCILVFLKSCLRISLTLRESCLRIAHGLFKSRLWVSLLHNILLILLLSGLMLHELHFNLSLIWVLKLFRLFRPSEFVGGELFRFLRLDQIIQN